MVKKIDNTIIDTVNKYIEEVKKHYHVNYVFLFGSFAKGNAHEDSDIDVAIISQDLQGEWEETLGFMKFRRNIDVRIEPHPITIEDYETNATSLVHEIKQHGIQLYAA